MKCHTFAVQRRSSDACRTWPGPGSTPGVPPSRGFMPNKPNFGRAGGSAGTDCVKQSQTWKGWDTWARASRARRRHQRVERAKQSQFPALPAGRGLGTRVAGFPSSPHVPPATGLSWTRLCETKPIWRACGPGSIGGSRAGRPTYEEPPGAQEQLCETKPILPGCPEMGAHRQAGVRTYWGQSCETKPIPREGKKWQVPGGERVMVDLPPGQPRQNKANFPRTAGRRLVAGGLVAQTKPISGRGLSCETKPISERWLAPRAGGTNKANWRGWPIVQNEPNFRRARYHSIPLFHHSSIPVRCLSCETKPICRRQRGTRAGAAIRHLSRPHPILRALGLGVADLMKGRVQWQHEYQRQRL